MTLKDSIVAAVYIDQTLKSRRASSLIVTGLPVDPTQSDGVIFTELCVNEFDIKPDITSTKRNGQLKLGANQPLLINLRLTDQAQLLLRSARQLRLSNNQAVKQQVFLNAKLIKA